MASAAWPHFVPRLELEVELKAYTARLDEVLARLNRQEPLISALEIRLEELLERCGGEAQLGRLATQAELSALEMRLNQLVSNEVMSLAVDLEELTKRAALQEALEGLRLSHDGELAALRGDAAALQGGVAQVASEQRDFKRFAHDTYLPRAQQLLESEELRRQLEVLERRLGEHEQRLLGVEEEKVMRERQLHGQEVQLEKLEILIKVQETCSQNLQGDLLALERRSWEEFAPKAALNQVFDMASEAQTKLDFAMMDRATIRQRLEEELDVVKKTLYRQQAAFNDMDAAAASVNQQELQLRRFEQRSEQQELALKALRAEQRRALESIDGLRALRLEDLSSAETSRQRLREQVEEQVSKCQLEAQSLSTSSARSSLEHMEKSLALKRSLDALASEHLQLRSHVLQRDEVKALRGEDGWQVSRSPG